MRNSSKMWRFPDPISIPASFQLAVGDSPLVAKTLFQRGHISPEDALAFLDPDQYTPAPSSELPGLEGAAARILQAVKQQEDILVWGDFDVDGQTSTSLLVSALRKIGARASHHIPIRAEESHGISLPVLSEKIKEFSPQLMITCDTGIDAIQETAYANQCGVDVIITDHHQLPPALPDAIAVVNPNTLPEDHPLRNLPGVGVAYKLIEEVYEHHQLDPSPLLDLVALGIVADVATLRKDTRYLLQRGLQVLRNSPRLGLLEIYKANELSPDQINEDHIGFVIGPRLNALGRLDDANSCVEFFTTKDPSHAHYLADQLEELNRRRQKITQEIFDQAINMIVAFPELVEEYPVLVLQGSPQWNPGVIGIVASRLVERFHKPAIMLSEDGDHARGSARSIPGVPISHLISTCDHLLTSHGGHPMAAGMRLPLTNVAQFRRCLADQFNSLIGDSVPKEELDIDAEIQFQAIDENLIADFQRLAPFGPGNPKLTFATRGVHTDPAQVKIIGRAGNHRKITFIDASQTQTDFLWWNSSDLDIPSMPVDIAYTLERSTYRGQSQIQATLLDIRQSPKAPVYIPVQDNIVLIDLRKNAKPAEAAAEHFSSASTIIWAENQVPDGLPSVPRSQLSSHDTLIIWTAPPDKTVLSQAVKSVSPKQLVLIGVEPAISSLDDFIKHLLGLIKHQIRRDKAFDLTRFAEVLSVPEDVVETGIEWLHQQGGYDLSRIHEGSLQPGPGSNLPDFPAVDKMLKHMLREVIAYRNYFKNAPIKAIL